MELLWGNQNFCRLQKGFCKSFHQHLLWGVVWKSLGFEFSHHPPPPSQSSSITAFRSLMVSLINFVAGWRRQTSQTRSYWIVISGYYSNYNKVDLLVFFFFSSHKKIYCQFYHAKQSHPTWRENALHRHWARWDPSFADDGSLWIQQGCKRN